MHTFVLYHIFCFSSIRKCWDAEHGNIEEIHARFSFLFRIVVINPKKGFILVSYNRYNLNNLIYIFYQKEYVYIGGQETRHLAWLTRRTFNRRNACNA